MYTVILIILFLVLFALIVALLKTVLKGKKSHYVSAFENIDNISLIDITNNIADIKTLKYSLPECYEKPNLKLGDKIYSLKDVVFYEDTRVSKIIFREIKEYRTVNRYVQRNYIKTPVYSNIKYKAKTVEKTVKLTNAEIENLIFNKDPLIRSFANKIISKISLKKRELKPSWFLKNILKSDYNEYVNHKIDELNKFYFSKRCEAEKSIAAVREKKCVIIENEKTLDNLKNQEIAIIRKIDLAQKRIKNKVLIFFSLGIVSVYSKKKIKKYQNTESEIKSEEEVCKKNISDFINDAMTYRIEINRINEDISFKISEIKKELDNKRKIFDLDISQVRKLNDEADYDNTFIPLKELSAYEYEYIIGCYIIKNRENGRCYVGQSKDVLKRIKQHFKGTVPKNPIFMEDYYNSGKDPDLFEVKIVRCAGKGVLDETERELIRKYDARYNGYNKTEGNI